MAVPYKLIARERALDTTNTSVHDHVRRARSYRRLAHKRWVARNFVRSIFGKKRNS